MILNERPQPSERGIPLRADLIEVPFRRFQTFAVQLPEPLTSAARMAHQARRAEGGEVLRDRLTRDTGAAAEMVATTPVNVTAASATISNMVSQTSGR